jgi:hypothetical protein
VLPEEDDLDRSQRFAALAAAIPAFDREEVCSSEPVTTARHVH